MKKMKGTRLVGIAPNVPRVASKGGADTTRGVVVKRVAHQPVPSKGLGRPSPYNKRGMK